ncbi:unnamed protein product [Caenorhabditis nigoni]
MAWCTPTIEFTKEVFFPGEQVTGRVWVQTKKDMTARNVEITFMGLTVTAWIVDGERRNRPVEDFAHKKAEELFLEMKHVVWTPEDHHNNFPAGDYEWKFSFDLPKECPTSFEGTFGFIRYFVRVHIDVPNWLDTKVDSAVTVSPNIDLNSIPGANGPVEIQVEKFNMKCACLPFLGNNGLVLYTIQSSKLGYVAGETVSIKGTIENRSSKTLSEIEAIFKRRVVYRKDLSNDIFKSRRDMDNAPDSYNSKKEEMVMQAVTEQCDIEPGTTKTFSFSFTVPPVVSTIRSSKFLNVEYFITMAADRQYCDSSEIPTFNLIVGNVPLMEKDYSLIPSHKFVKADSAKCWSTLLKPKFRYQIPYYGHSEAAYHSEDSD